MVDGDAAHPHRYSVNMVVNLFAGIIFASLMVLFWWVIGSNEVRRTVERKADVLRTVRRQLGTTTELRDIATMMDVGVYRAEREMREEAALQKVARDRYNLQMVWTYMGPFLGLLLGLLFAFIAHNRVMTMRHTPCELERGHWFGLVAVFLSYVPEVLFFLFVIEHFTIVGDYELLQRAAGFR